MSLFATVVTDFVFVRTVFPGVEMLFFCPTSLTSKSGSVIILLSVYPYKFCFVVALCCSGFGVVYAFLVCGRELAVDDFEVPENLSAEEDFIFK